MDGYCYTVNNKKGKAVDFWLMDKPTPKEANFIFSCRFSRYVKPKSKPIEKMFNEALNQELKSQMPNEQVAWEQGYEAGLAQGKYDRPQGEPVIKCQDCKYRIKEWREDKRMKEKGYWVYGCEHFGELMGYWGFGGNDNEFCSDAERKGGAE